MTKLKLIKPSINYKREFFDFMDDYKSTGEILVPFILKFDMTNFNKYIQQVLNFSKGIGVPKDKIEHSTYWLKNEENNVIGVVNIRHRLNQSLKIIGGHIGFGIGPKFRKQGFGTLLLSLALKKAKKLGINKALLTCDKTNIGSAKVIINNNGILDSEEYINGELIQRYWIYIT